MSEVIICDTNVAIHLAIICPDILQKPQGQYKIVLHPLVKTELHKLNENIEKNKRLGDIFALLLKTVQTFTQLATLNDEKERRQHQILRKLEEGLTQLNSASSSYYDRQLLILAKINSKKLLTNDKTLHQLASAFIGADKTWRTGDAISSLLGEGLITAKNVQAGLDKMKDPYEESLNSNCVQLLKGMGYTFK